MMSLKLRIVTGTRKAIMQISAPSQKIGVSLGNYRTNNQWWLKSCQDALYL